MPSYHIGTLSPEAAAALASGASGGASAANDSSEPRPVFLNSKAWTPATLTRKRPVSSDTTIFTFALSHERQRIGLPVGQHLMMRVRDAATGESIIRAYTPISDDRDDDDGMGCSGDKNADGTVSATASSRRPLGELDVLVKIYRPSATWTAGGKMTQALDRVPIGGTVDFKGPVGRFQYLGRGLCSVAGKERHVQRFIMLCAGSGVTPIFQVLRAVLTDSKDETRCLVLDGNREESDILCREELDALAESEQGRARCRLVYALSRPPEHWTGVRGRVGRDLVVREMGSTGTYDAKTNNGDLVLVCGPEAMEADVRAMFKDMGWPEDSVLFF